MTGPTGTAVRVVLTTAPTVEVARDLGSAVVGERLAACANVLPGVTSIYRWEGEVKREGEALVILKTTAGAVERLRARIVELHPYDVPEVVVLNVDGLPDRRPRNNKMRPIPAVNMTATSKSVSYPR